MSFTKSKLWADLPDMIENELCSSCIYSESADMYNIFLGRNEEGTKAVHWCYCVYTKDKKVSGIRVATASCKYYDPEILT